MVVSTGMISMALTLAFSMRRMKSMVIELSVTLTLNWRTIARSMPPACVQMSKFESTVEFSSRTSKVRWLAAFLLSSAKCSRTW